MSAEDNSDECVVQKCRDQIIKNLEEVLELAMAGGLAGVAIAIVETDGRQSNFMIGYDHQSAMIAAVTVLQHRVVQSAIDLNMVMH